MTTGRKRRGKRSLDEHWLRTEDWDGDIEGPSRDHYRNSSTARGRGTTKEEKKLKQLCRQVERRLSLVFDELDDPFLEDLQIDAVFPEPGNVLMVAVRSRSDTVDVAVVLERLNAAMGRLRSEIAAAIHRKRTPRLAFSIVGTDTESCEEEP